VFFQWDTIGKMLYAKINFAAKQSLSAPEIVAMSPLTLAALLGTFVGEAQFIALYGTLLADAVLADLEVLTVADKGRSNWTYADYGGNQAGEQSTVSLTGVAVTAGNFAAQEALHDALTAAFAGVIVSATLYKHEFGNSELDMTHESAISPLNQREKKWLCRCTDDTTGEKVTFTIPGADLTLLDADNADYMDPDNAAYTALASAIHDYARNPETGNVLTLVSCEFVGRNV
jgi:hypothetical protein